MPGILVTGSNGQLGQAIKSISAEYPGMEFWFYDIDRLDITDKTAVLRLISELKPEYLINCAGYTAVDKAESEKALRFGKVEAIKEERKKQVEGKAPKKVKAKAKAKPAPAPKASGDTDGFCLTPEIGRR